METNDAIDNAKAKVLKKNFDFIVLNTLQDPGAGFGHNTNKITIIDQTSQEIQFELKSKSKNLSKKSKRKSLKMIVKILQISKHQSPKLLRSIKKTSKFWKF